MKNELEYMKDLDTLVLEIVFQTFPSFNLKCNHKIYK
jgi:hypothetical protein